MDGNYPNTLGFQDSFQIQISDFFQSNDQWIDEESLPPLSTGYNAQHQSYAPHEVIADNTAALDNTSFQQDGNYNSKFDLVLEVALICDD